MSESEGGTFFGLIVKPNKRYDSKVKESFRISKACIEPSSASNKVTSLYVEYESEEYIIANLGAHNLNENLDLGFSIGETVAFKVEGPGTVHLTGNIESDPDLMDTMMEDEDSDEEIDIPQVMEVGALKRKKGESNSAAKKMKVAVNGTNDESSDNDSDEDSDNSEEGETTLGDLDSTTNFAEEEDSDDDEEDDDDDEEDDDEEEEVSESEDDSDEEEEEKPSPKKSNGDIKQTPGKKKPEEKKEVKTPKPEAAKEPKTPKQDVKSPKKEGKTPKQEVKTPKPETKTPKPEAKTPKQDAKTPKQDAKTPKQDANAPKQDAKTPKQDAKTPKKEPKTPKQDGKADVNTPKSTKKTIKGGIQVEELKEGTGPACKPGQAVGMYYSGRLKSNNKQFDSCTSGKPFKFKLGKGEVIKGWDIGVAGLKVGGKRRLTIPPNMGYGSAGAPPDIPPNSTLVFDVECKYVN